ncbi:hypothetical protein LBMAG42_37010 [Deltaproteobacteria bacterium]|nr:hypothetical protein LBMAG42_37010 [Deltaproteobacteria bacterium]
MRSVGGPHNVVPESVNRIQDLLHRTARRCVVLTCGQSAALSLAAFTLGLSGATLAANEGARGATFVMLCLGVVAALGFAWLRLRGLRERAAPRSQAARIESLHPNLRGGLFAVVDRAARPMGSPGLFARLTEDVARRLAAVRPTEVWPGRPLWRDLRWTLLGVLSLILVSLAAPLGPLDALRLLSGSNTSSAAVSAVKADGPRALLGDITLRYLYPTYTRLEPLEIPNTSGEVRAPLGTVVEVRARTAQPWTQAALHVAGQPVVPATLVDGREVQGSFVVEGEGSYRFEFGELPSPDYLIVPDADLAPTVAVKAIPRIQVAVDDRVTLPFSVKDDYGISKVVLEVTRAGAVSEVPLRTPLDLPRAVSDTSDFSAAELGLAAGDSVKVRIGAWDNDEVSGSKPGWSAVFTLEVLGANGSGAQRTALRSAFFEALLPALADFVVDAAPAADEGDAARRWAEGAEQRYAAFDDVSQASIGLGAQTFEARLVKNVNSPRRDLLAFARGLPPGKIVGKDAATLTLLQETNLRALEMAVWTLDKIARATAYRELMELVKVMAGEAAELRDDLAGLNPAQALARLDMLARLKAQVDGKVTKLDQGSMRSFLQSRGLELDGAMAAARRALSAGKDEQARVEMARVADLLAEMAGGVEEAQKRGSGGGDELEKDIKALSKELEDLGAAQSELAARTESARREHGQSLDDGLAAWKEVDRLAAEAERAMGEKSLQGVKGARSVASAVDDAAHDVSGLDDSVRARDTRTALDRAEDAQRSIERARTRVQSGARSGQVDPAAAASAERALQQAQRATDAAVAKLQELAEAQSAGSPELAEELRSLSGDQGELADRAQKVSDHARKVARSLPADASELEQAAEEGAEEAQRGADAMQDGDAMGAAGAQSAAQSAFERAQDALQQALQDMSEMNQAGQGGQGGEEAQKPGERNGGAQGQDGEGRQEVSIPAPEEFETPEAYRKALLEGMQGVVPEAYRATNRRYYEELVRQ